MGGAEVSTRGYVETPAPVVDQMIAKLLRGRLVTAKTTVLDPGCAGGAFIEGIIRWCESRDAELPQIIGVDLDHHLLAAARARFRPSESIRLEQADFLHWIGGAFDFIVGNPPYVPITELSESEKSHYRALFDTAKGRFDLYILFFEKALRALKPGGRLVFVTPEKFLYVDTARPLRRLLAALRVQEIDLVPENTFGELITYPTITTVTNRPGPVATTVRLRDGTRRKVQLPADGQSWQPVIQRGRPTKNALTLADVCLRVSCGVATGADSVYVLRNDTINSDLRPFAYPTIAGRELTPEVTKLRTTFSMLVPYAREGRLLREEELESLSTYLSEPCRKAHLLRRTCVARKPWYAFHENPPMSDILRPKVLCKDITSRPHFWIDWNGAIIPRHSVYYAVPRDPSRMEDLVTYLNSSGAGGWLEAHCQRAANGFLRLQSQVLKQLPLPPRLAATAKVEFKRSKAAAAMPLGAAG